MKAPLALALGLVALAAGSGSPPGNEPRDKEHTSAVISALKRELQPEIEKHLADEQAAALKALERGRKIPAHFKTPLAVKALTDPWAGMTDLERHGLTLAADARRGLGGIGRLIDGLLAGAGKPAGAAPAVPRPKKLETVKDHTVYLTAVLDRAKQLRDEALAKLSDKDRDFLFSQPAYLVPSFGPQLSLNDRTKGVLLNDRAFCGILRVNVDWEKLGGAAKELAALADPGYLARLKNALASAEPVGEAVQGATGAVLGVEKTRHGLLVFGGKGPNTYHLKGPAAVIVDLGGDDHYRGAVAASFDVAHPFGVVIDLGGDDTYEGDELMLATGRLGVGMLLDLAGKDTYKLAPGSGGAGFGGVGILCDAAGDDTYTGTRMTQGAAVAGVGLLLDLAGNDRHTSYGFGVGFGGPGGAAAVIDAAGNDSYQCGHKYPSGYNKSDAPNAKPGDPEFQWECFGLGTGLGRRVFPPGEEAMAYNLAGGLGAVIDLDGDDTYDSSNFSQACGYFFGVGLKLDLKGDDVHGAARYGHAAGAHYGVGLCIDYAGKDRWASSGPTYNCGCAWDQSVFLCIDAGGDDRYDLERSAGLGVADHGSWGVFADLGGRDRYRPGGGLARAEKSLAAFFDREGEDDYAAVKDFPARPANGSIHVTPSRALFVDRAAPGAKDAGGAK